MSPRNDDDFDADEATDQIIISHGKPTHGTLMDPRAAMPGSVKRVGGDHPPAEKGTPLGTKAELSRKYFEMVQFIAHPPEEHKGKLPEELIVPAIAHVFNLPYQEAELRQIELDDALTNAARGLSFGDTLRKTKTDVNARTARLGEFLYSPNPKVALVAAKILNDMDEGSTSSVEETIEDHIASLLEEA